ncbi:hypothetical protein SLEP1_g45875 [Rubroshorea leprosula]|uniref:BHLH domain-containing protein n=1 Tax=Rubroshorea leprosula TaxID=152421 RepID=A0AAV5LMT2_9ROSI|nr:hypothetical protein SLEP1_g45875 [Rubroshorea leprosula]
MASVISNPVGNTNSDRIKRRKKKKSLIKEDQQQNQSQNWKSEAQQQIYSSKLIKALNQVSLNSPSPSAPRGGRAVRETADRVLAVAAKGRTRWSRAILTNRIKLKFRKQKRPRASPAVTAAVVTNRAKKPRVSVRRLKSKSLPAVQRKVKVLGRLVPGCRKQSLPVILEEATDYIPALEMQVRALSTLFELLSGSSAAPSSSAPPPPPPPPPPS